MAARSCTRPKTASRRWIPRRPGLACRAFLLEDVSFYAGLVKTLARKAEIDPPSNLAHSRIYLFTGGADSVVSSKTVEKGRAVYAALGVPSANIVFEDDSGPAARAGHSWVTRNFGGKCSANKAPYINDCAYDQAGAELKAIYGTDLNPPAASPSGKIVAFDQTEFVPAGATNGLLDAGYLYVPKDCEPALPRPARLHIVLHGCTQSSEARLGMRFYTKIGVNEWADSNRIVVLYPQAHATTVAELPPQAKLDGGDRRQSQWLLELVGIRRGSTLSDEKWRPEISAIWANELRQIERQ